MEHAVTITAKTRQLGRTRVTDYHWLCSCGERSTAPTGYRNEREARTNHLFHRR
ncbi:hypothetical protein [Amycolatopsis sp. NPDC004079]|uniref:hypothetical protein n=1 Tax=Amycolatopsis sp. NPDC004079 TaxID=3154549 RepID=UPI0033B6989B